ncbi:hypothetical protein [Fulvivirga lutimaris]|uniref:hypothetical protein n=1 Tax=Fulvivirga lutimaris TaxID=1819566 RepID=UPI0012BBE577|nr:hypothetical protein [Fulvivirga lutimaris]MTI38307.1 hypothetical protein [Fulvivirga lutimaris]
MAFISVSNVERKVDVNRFIYPVILFLFSSLNIYAQKAHRLSSVLFGEYNIDYLVYKPESINQKAPLLIFLHGSGQTGGDLNKVKTVGPPSIIEGGQDLPFYTVAPQLPYKLAAEWPPELIHEIIQEVKNTYPIDPKRVYLVGFSKGAAGVWKYCSQYPKEFAAAIPITGYGDKGEVCKIKSAGIWAFHGRQDNLIKPKATRQLVEQLKLCNSNVLYTEYAEGEHDVWTATFKNMRIYEWLLNYEIGSPPKMSNEEFIMSNMKSDNLSYYKLPTALKNISGLELDSENNFWGVNNTGAPVIFRFDTLGNINQFVRVSLAANYSWQDLTIDEKGNFYIGDVGNKTGSRKNLQIYKVNILDERINRVNAEVITLTLPKYNGSDFESILWHKGYVHLFSNSAGNDYLYHFKVPDSPGNHKAELIDSLYIQKVKGRDNKITSSDLSKDGKTLYLLGADKVLAFSDFTLDYFLLGTKSEIDLDQYSQKRALSINTNGDLFFSDAELTGFNGGFLYRLKVNPEKNFKSLE